MTLLLLSNITINTDVNQKTVFTISVETYLGTNFEKTINITSKVSHKSVITIPVETYLGTNLEIKPVETNFGTNLEKTEKCNYIEYESPQVKLKSIFNISNKDIRNIFNIRSATMRYTDIILFMIKHPLYIDYDLNSRSDIFYHDVNKRNLRINWLYLGRSLSQNKYAPTHNVSSSKKPKSALLIIILLFMFGDTGAFINPGPVCINDKIDPDLNHFISDFEFQSHSVETFVENSNHVKDSFNIIHNNARSLNADGRMDEYIMLLKI